jgi:prepilin-type N-terminal cleavage/methylation domain-containing protein
MIRGKIFGVGKRRGFTLVELVVAIAIIIMLAAILVPVAMTLLGGRSLTMAKSVIDGYLGGVRMEAVNRGRPVLVAILPPTTSVDASGNVTNSGPWKIRVASPEGADRVEEFQEGMVAFMLEEADSDQNTAWNRVRYMNRNLEFRAKFSSNVKMHPAKIAEWKTSASKLPPSARINYSDLTALGIPKDAFLIYVREDGQAVIPADRAGFQIDSVEPVRMDADLVLIDDRLAAFLDISVGLRVRGRVFSLTEIRANPRYGIPAN